MDRLFYSKSVAVIDVSGKPDHLALIIVRNLIDRQVPRKPRP